MLLVVRSVRALPTTQEPGKALDIVGPAEPSMLGGRASPFSRTYMCHPNCNCLRLFMQAMDCALALALANAGDSMPARIAMMAMTTSSSMSVNPLTRVYVNPDSVPNGRDAAAIGDRA